MSYQEYQAFACATNFFNAKVRPYYMEPHRAYHTPSHITDMLALAYHYLPDFLSIEQTLAVLFHDAVYIPGCLENEELSVKIMRTLFKQQKSNLPADFEFVNLDIVEKIILDTKSHIPSIEESAIVLDLDMSILGSAPHRYDEYVKSIDFEFALFHEAELKEDKFIAGRRNFLKSIIGTPIFTTPVFSNIFEEAAQANLERELKQLGQAGG